MLSADTNKSSGVYTCQTCNSLFTCLDYYQKHRRQHAETEGVKLFTCAHCTYVSDNLFHYNWHIMSHASSSPHRCDVCAPNQVSKQFDERPDDSNNFFGGGSTDASNGLDDTNDLHETTNQFISSTILTNDGKRRSIATETSDDLITLSELYSTSPLPLSPTTNTNLNDNSSNESTKRDDIYHNSTDTIDTRQLVDDNEPDDNATIIQGNITDQDDEAENDEETEEDGEETDVEPSETYEMNNNNGLIQQQQQQTNCDINSSLQLQQMYFENDENFAADDENDEEEDEVENQSKQVVQQITEYQEFNQQILPNGYASTSGTMTNQDGSLLPINDLGTNDNNFEMDEKLPSTMISVKNNCDTIQPLLQIKSDIYDFHSDEDLDHHEPSIQHQQFKLNITTKSSPPIIVQQSNQQNANINQTSFNSSQTHLTASNTLQIASLANINNASPHAQGLPIVSTTTGGNRQSQSQTPGQQFQTRSQPPRQTAAAQQIQPFIAHTMNANFLFPGASTTGPFGQQNTVNQSATIFHNANPFTGTSSIRLVPLQPFQQNPRVNVNVNQTQQTLTTTNSFIQPQINGTCHNNSLNLPQSSNIAVESVPSLMSNKKNLKKSSSTSSSSSNGNISSIASINNNSNGVTTLINQEYVPMKGQGKGNRKPRISFVSVINGVTVGADGIRRKFHCSHCGNGKSFKTKSHLQRHMLTHTGEKPYQCQECGAKFNQSSSLRNHIIAIHTKQFPHTCGTCGKGFLMPAVLQKHIQTTGHQSAVNIDGAQLNETMSNDSSFVINKIKSEPIDNLSMQHYSDSNENSGLGDGEYEDGDCDEDDDEDDEDDNAEADDGDGGEDEEYEEAKPIINNHTAQPMIMTNATSNSVSSINNLSGSTTSTIINNNNNNNIQQSQSLAAAASSSNPLLFILTNSRAG